MQESKTFYNLGSRLFTLEDQTSFAKASGDFNPIHVNPIIARRTIYGKCIVHGIHGLIWALNIFFMKFNSYVTKINVHFKKPIFLDQKVYCKYDIKKNLILIFFRNTIFTEIFININENHSFKKTIPLLSRSGLKSPQNKKINLIKQNKKNLHYFYGKKKNIINLFSSVSKTQGNSFLYELISLSEIVGMRAPGLNSIFASLNVRVENNNLDPYFVIKKKENRVGLLNIQAKGRITSSEIIAFFRPPVVKVPSCKFIKKKSSIKKNEFKSIKALIIGGSRGLGAWIAKFIAIGHGSMTITFAKGKEDSVEIKNDINSYGGNCKIVKLNLETSTTDNINFKNYNQIYYFATPKIIKNYSKTLNKGLLKSYSKFYIDFFKDIVSLSIKDNAIKRIFYPSTILIDNNEIGFKEYILAKKKGEDLCRKINNKYGNSILISRLPRIDTDQTSSFIKIRSSDPRKVLLPIIRSMKKKIEN